MHGTPLPPFSAPFLFFRISSCQRISGCFSDKKKPNPGTARGIAMGHNQQCFRILQLQLLVTCVPIFRGFVQLIKHSNNAYVPPVGKNKQTTYIFYFQKKSKGHLSNIRKLSSNFNVTRLMSFSFHWILLELQSKSLKYHFKQ